MSQVNNRSRVLTLSFLQGFVKTATADGELTRFVAWLQVQVAAFESAPANYVFCGVAENIADCQINRFLLDHRGLLWLFIQPKFRLQSLHLGVQRGVSGECFVELVLQLLPQFRLGLGLKQSESLRRLQHKVVHFLVRVHLHQVRVKFLQPRDLFAL